jgi:ABC-type iron transport system FetAB ATPase subunit
MKLKTKTTYLITSSSIWLPQWKGKSVVQKRICLLLRPQSGLVTLHQSGKRKANQWLQLAHF